MNFTITTLKPDATGATEFGREEVKFSRPHGSPDVPVMRLSDVSDCKRFLFVETDAGWDSGAVLPDREQLCVCLEGTLLLTSAVTEERQEIGAGDTWKVTPSEGTGHSLRVTSDKPARLLVIQLD